MNAFIPSIGHLLLLSILLSVMVYGFFKNLKVSKQQGDPGRTSWFSLSLIFIPGALLVALYHYVFSHLIFN
jgi:hypothetical protein